MQDITIWHNPRCSKSRIALAYLEEKEIIPTIYNYMDENPSVEDLKKVLNLLNIDIKQWMRTKEDIFKELNLNDIEDENTLLEAMAKNPKLIERPVIINANKAVIARPTEKIDEIL